MQKSKFWGIVEDKLQMEGIEQPWRLSLSAISTVESVLLNIVQNIEQWQNYLHPDRNLVFYLLCALKYGATDKDSPKAWSYDPAEVTLHNAEEFTNLLYQRSPRGSISFLWILSGDDTFIQPSNKETYLELVSSSLDGYTEEEECKVRLLEGAAVGIIRGKKVDVYPVPKNWEEVTGYVRHDLDKMTAVEKATKELSHELKAFVDLLGWETVNAKLHELRS